MGLKSKTRNKIFTLSLLASLALFGCSGVNVTNQEFVGSYTLQYVEQTEADDENYKCSFAQTSTCVYSVDNRFRDSGTLRRNIEVDVDGQIDYLTIVYKYSSTGHWKLLDGNKLIEQCDDVNVEKVEAKLRDQNPDVEFEAMRLVDVSDNDLLEIKDEMYKEAIYNIISFDDKGVVLEDIADGTQLDFTRTN